MKCAIICRNGKIKIMSEKVFDEYFPDGSHRVGSVTVDIPDRYHEEERNEFLAQYPHIFKNEYGDRYELSCKETGRFVGKGKARKWENEISAFLIPLDPDLDAVELSCNAKNIF